jgi:hypothetical protein
VDITFVTSQVDPAERLGALRELVNRVFLPLAITPLPATGHESTFGASVTGCDWGGMRIWRVKATPMSAVRCAGAGTTSPTPSSPTVPSPKSPSAGASAALHTSPAPSTHATASPPPSSAAKRYPGPAGQHQARSRMDQRSARAPVRTMSLADTDGESSGAPSRLEVADACYGEEAG